MKYKIITKLKSCMLISTSENRYYFLLGDYDNKKLVEIDNEINFTKNIDLFEMNNISQFKITSNNLIASFKNKKTIFYSIKGDKLLELEKQLYLSFMEENEIYIYIKNKNYLYRFNKIKNQLNVFNILDKPLFTALCNCYLILETNNCIYVYADDKLICEFEKKDYTLAKSAGYYIVFCEIPDDLKDPHLRIRVDSKIKSLEAITLPVISYGYKSDIIFHKLKKEIYTIVISAFMIFNFIIILIIVINNKKFFEQEHYGILHLALFGMTISFYFLTQLWTISYMLNSIGETLYIAEYTLFFCDNSSFLYFTN